MDQKPVFLTEYSLGRVIKSYAMTLGLNDTMADATAQVYLQTNPSAHNWSVFLQKNCGECSYSPQSCTFMNPQDEDIQGGATPESVKTAVALQIEAGRLRVCPAKMHDNR